MSTIPQRIGKYELQKLLGSGSVGEVWKSYDLQYHRDVGVKVFYTDLQSDPGFLERVCSQGQLLASLDHPNIVRILDANVARVQEANGTVAYMVMEYIEGSTLADSLQNTSRRGAFPPVSDIVSLFTRLGAAIDYAHEQGIIHGNIKPANILLRRSMLEETKVTPSFPAPSTYGEPMLVDFGIVRPTNSSERNSVLYISPEQAKGLPATRHSDIYALGVMLYEICTGVPPFRSESPVVLMMQHTQMQPISPTLINANIPSDLSAVILRALAKDSATCFSSASEMAAALADVCSGHIELNSATVEAQVPASLSNKGRSIAPGTDVSTPERSTDAIWTIAGIARLPVHAGQLAHLAAPLSEVSAARFNTSGQLAAIPDSSNMDGYKVSERGGRRQALPLHPSLLPPLQTLRRFEPDSSRYHSRPYSTASMGEIPVWTHPRLTTPTSPTLASMDRWDTEKAAEFSESSTPTRATPPRRADIKSAPTDYRGQIDTGQIPTQLDIRGFPTFSSSSTPTETPPAMPAVPSPWVSAPLVHIPPGPLSPLSLPPPKRGKRLAPTYAWLSASLLLVIIGTMLGMLFWLHPQSATSSRTVGHIFFQNDSSGQNDVLRIELQNIPNPPPGKSYDAWLVIDEPGNSPTPIFLGKLVVSSGTVNFFYPGNVKHSDLLANVSGLLITEEDANGTPSFPSSKEVYTAAFAQTTAPTDAHQLSVLTSVRDLLSGTSALNKLGIAGGLAQWLLRDISKVWLWASNARDYWQGTGTNISALNLIRGQIVHIVDVFEGKQLDASDAPIAQVALLEQNAVAPDYLDASLSRLNTIAAASDASADQKTRAHRILGELQQVKSWLQRVHQDALQLLNLTDQQFIQPQTQSLLDDLAMQANEAYNGQNDLSANATQHAGMAQIYSDIQGLATFDVIPFKA